MNDSFQRRSSNPRAQETVLHTQRLPHRRTRLARLYFEPHPAGNYGDAMDLTIQRDFTQAKLRCGYEAPAPSTSPSSRKDAESFFQR